MTKIILLFYLGVCLFVGVDQNAICVRAYKNFPILFWHAAVKIFWQIIYFRQKKQFFIFI